MEIIRLSNVSFTYPNETKKALCGISFSVRDGEFVTLCGKSGCGKSTLLRSLKPALASFGERSGEICFAGRQIATLSHREQSEKIGFVLQSPENQIVTDKVWHELAFGLESLGFTSAEIRVRVAEMASFFGIQGWFYKNVSELSGGQKQLLNLASVMVMQPSLLILDEPTAQLDPIAAQEFLDMLSKINRELGITVLLSEHHLEEAFAVSDRVIVMDEGRIIANGTPAEVGTMLKSTEHDMFAALPAAMRVYAAVQSDLPCPVTVRDGRGWLENFAREREINREYLSGGKPEVSEQIPFIELRDVWYRYEKNLPDVVRGLSVKIHRGELYAIVGGNAAGKTTALSVLGGLFVPQRGKVLINGENILRIRDLHGRLLVMLPQNPQTIFVKKTVELDLYEMLADKGLSQQEQDERVQSVVRLCRLEECYKRHPYDISGGEQQRAALAKVLLSEPQILLLDEPTKGMDAYFKEEFAEILSKLCSAGVSVVMVSHDIEFCAQYADRCGLFFDGNIVSEGRPREFFAGKSFYTTAANRMSRGILSDAVLVEDIIHACGGEVQKSQKKVRENFFAIKKDIDKDMKKDKKRKNFFSGVFFLLLFLLTTVFCHDRFVGTKLYLLQALEILLLGLGLYFLVPKKEKIAKENCVKIPMKKRRLSKRTVLGIIAALTAIPITLFLGIYFLGERKYYFISMLIMLEAMLPFGLLFEGRKPQARELVIISVLCGIAVSGRAAFFMLPHFKPVATVVILTGVCFGAEAGFLTGAVTAFVSNFFFGQGPWTPWQMFAYGLLGLTAGILYQKGFLRKTRGSLCVFGAVVVLVLYGGIMNPASVIMSQARLTWMAVVTSYLTGFPLDLIHAASTVFFLWFAADAMIEKLERVKTKYGLLN